MIETAAWYLQALTEKKPDVPFVRCGGNWLTYRELDLASDRVAAGLAQLGINKGDRVALIVPNRPEMLELFFACAKLGAVQVPLNYWLKGEFLRHQLMDCAARILVADDAGVQAAEVILGATEIEHVVLMDSKSRTSLPSSFYSGFHTLEPMLPQVRVTPQDVASINYTSGTTGLPKGCVLPHRYYVVAANAARQMEWIVPGDRLFTAYPLFHMSGVHSLMEALVGDASLVIEPEFHASTFMKRAVEAGASVIAGVGPMGMAILAQPASPEDGLHPMRLARFIPMHPERQAEFEARFKTPIMAEGWGQTECSPATLSPVNGPRKAGAAGRALEHLEIKAVDDFDREVSAGSVGELVIRPRQPDVMYRGYWRNPQATVDAQVNLWHHTGDYGAIDEDGYVTFIDRKKDALRRRGENVSSFQIEVAISQHPAIVQVAVSAVPSPLGEDDIKASVVLRSGASLDPNELFGFFQSSLPYFAIPRYLDIRDSLPVNALGRVMKETLRSELVTDDMWDFQNMGLEVRREERRLSAPAHQGLD
jgi:carnitine-CoA ligase